MRFGALAIAACVSLLACRPAGEPKGAQILLVHIEHFEGSYELAVWENGHARHTSARGHGFNDEQKKTVATRLDGDDLDSLAKILRQRRFCELKGSDRPGVPDEARPHVEVHYGGLDCSVSMWDDDWHADERARQCLEAVEALAKRVKERGD